MMMMMMMEVKLASVVMVAPAGNLSHTLIHLFTLHLLQFIYSYVQVDDLLEPLEVNDQDELDAELLKILQSEELKVKMEAFRDDLIINIG
jgi:hypothetical protein